ncbi:MAG: DEAD/DEAH box helicase [Bacillota bacterium]
MEQFRSLGISDAVLRALSDIGFEEPTPVQAQTIPTALAGRDLIGQAQTGTGKTAAFGIPLIERIKGSNTTAAAVVLAPTRELAIQVAEELNRIAQYAQVNALPIYGGQDIRMQIRSLSKHPQVIVATPGRLMDHMRRRTIHLDSTQIVVLDEADEMLNMGFVEDIEQILGAIPATRQTLLFSATMPKAIQNLAQRFLDNPEYVSIKTKEITVPLVEQFYIELQERQKFDTLCRLLDIQSPELCIIFGRTKRRVDELSEALKKRGYTAEGIHGDLMQGKRDTVLRQFREGITTILVATDVAARGLDVSGVTHVYNFDIPQDPESYVHRIGRTGRAGQTGSSVTFVTPREIEHLSSIERITKRKIVRMPIPTVTEAVEGQQRLVVDRLLRIVEEGNYEEYRGRAEELLADIDSVTLISAALRLLTKEPDTTPVSLTEIEPLRVRTARKPVPNPYRRQPQSGQHRQGYRGNGGDRKRQEYAHPGSGRRRP